MIRCELALITPTSDRPVAFALCERWMERAIARYGKPVRWYVIDDGREPVTCHLDQFHVRRQPAATTLESFLGNVATGLAMAEEIKVLFIEDDDWYGADYLSQYAARLDEADIVGECPARSYNPTQRLFHVWDSDWHASLCQTGIRHNLADWLLEQMSHITTPFLDMELWRAGREKFRFDLRADSGICVGMKGVGGRPGFTDGHDGHPKLTESDPRGHVLRKWIGDDAEAYIGKRPK